MSPSGDGWSAEVSSSGEGCSAVTSPSLGLCEVLRAAEGARKLELSFISLVKPLCLPLHCAVPRCLILSENGNKL